MREFAVVLTRADLKVNRAILSDVSMAPINEGFDHRDLLRDMRDRAGLHVRSQ